MYTMNQITIIGFTGNDAEAHFTQNGTLARGRRRVIVRFRVLPTLQNDKLLN